MKGGSQQGFTIVEVMIVLAVTGALLVSAMILVAGRQRRTEFEQAIQQMRLQIQQTVNEVATGFYPNISNFQCTAGGAGPNLTAGSATQGTNSGCIFLGKVIQFDVTGTDPEQFVTYTIAGLQKASGGTEVSSLSEARPLPVAPSTSQPGIPDATNKATMQGGLTTAWMRYNGTQNIGAVGFLSSLAAYNSGTIMSGTQQVNLVPIPNTGLNAATATTANTIGSELAQATLPLNPSGGVQICFVSGGTNQSGLITIGSNNRQLAVKLDIKDNPTCT